MENQSKLSKYGIKYIFRMCLQLLLQIGIILITAGTFHVGNQLMIYFIIITLCYFVELAVLAYKNPEVLNERVKNMKAGTKSWDKVLLSLYVFCAFMIMNIFIGLDIRYNWAHFHFNYLYIGLVLYLFSSIVSIKSLLINKYFESSSRIQTERNQAVISAGVYSVIRHPGYSSIIMWAISIPLFTGAVCTLISSAVIIIIIFVRTYLEDRMLKEELIGYQEYSQKVKCRLIPYIW